MGEKVLASLNDDRIVAKNEIDEILKFYHVKAGRFRIPLRI